MPRWLEGREGELLDLVRAHGPNRGLLAQRMGVTPDAIDSASRRHPELRAGWRDAVTEYRTNAVEDSPALSPEVATLAERFRPVTLPAPELRECVYTPSPVDVVASDFHFPKARPESVAILLATVLRLRPEHVYLIGDLWDLMAYSRYEAELRATFTWSPQDEVAAGAAFLYQLETIVSAWGGRVIALPGNHEARWWHYLNRTAPALVKHPAALRQLDFKTWWVPEWSRLEWSEEDILIPGQLPIVLTHGELVRKEGGYSANAHGKKYHAGVIHGHTHRLGQSTDFVPGLEGYRGDGWIDAYEIGCMCEMQPIYVKRPNWAPGFAIVRRDNARELNGVELVKIRGGAAMVNTLGGVVTV